MESPQTTSPWIWLVPTALGTAGLVALARHRQRNAASTRKRAEPDPRTYWQQRTIPTSDKAAQVEALARIIASEARTQPDEIKRVVAWMARNRSNWSRRTLVDLAAPGGVWGPTASNRPFGSHQPGGPLERVHAESTLDARQEHDPSRGATHGFHRHVQDQLARCGHTQHDSNAVHRLWTKHYHLQPILEIGSWIFYQSSNKR